MRTSKTPTRTPILMRMRNDSGDRPNERPDESPDEQAQRIQPARGHIERGGTVRHHLRHVHLAPLPLRRRLQSVDARDYFVDGF